MTDPVKVEFDFKWVYDLKPVVAEAEPEHVVALVTGAKKTKYLTMPDTAKVFPVEFFPEDSLIEVWPSDKVLDPSYDPADEAGFELAETEVGGIFAVSLLYTACNYQAETGVSCRVVGPGRIQRRDGIQTLEAGLLEKKIESTKEQFAKLIENAGIEVDRAQIYPRFRTY